MSLGYITPNFTLAAARARIGFVLLYSLLLFTFLSQAHGAKIIELDIKGAIGPATADYIVRHIEQAQNSSLILILLDTPGGLDQSTRLISQHFLSSKIPVVVYVSPTGARAASAGTYLLYASTIAAMAPGTQLGAASPVSLGTGLQAQEEPKQLNTMQKKMTQDAAATIRALAQLRGRNAQFAQQAVLDAKTLTATEALQEQVIEYIAVDVPDLLRQLHGTSVVQNHQKITLNTQQASIEKMAPDWRTYFLSLITEPTIAYLLLLLGIYGIFFELMNPGYVLPGVVGAIAMVIALYALQLLPVNYAGFTLILLGITFVIAEAFLPSFGSLGVGGTLAFILGSIMLMNTQSADFQIARPVIFAMAVVNLFIFIILVGALLKARQQKVHNGLEVLLGAKGRALGDINLQGQAIIRGEIWSVDAPSFIAADKPIKVVGVTGLVLHVVEETKNQGE